MHTHVNTRKNTKQHIQVSDVTLSDSHYAPIHLSDDAILSSFKSIYNLSGLMTQRIIRSPANLLE